MITENRDPAFWRRIQRDPTVKFAFSRSGIKIDLAEIATNHFVRPFASENGGFLAIEMLPGSARYWDIHAAFTAGRNPREVHAVGVNMVDTLFREGAVELQVTQRADEPSHRPPLSFGWEAGSNPEPMKGRAYNAISWILTRKMWYSSTTYRRIHRG